MRPTTEKRSFDVDISDQRLAEIAREIADNLETIQVLTTNLSEAKEAAKGIPGIMKHIRELGTFIKEGAENITMDCRIVYDDPVPGAKSYYRPDTNELVDTKEMTGEELQGELSIGENGSLSLPPKPDPDQPQERSEE